MTVRRWIGPLGVVLFASSIVACSGEGDQGDLTLPGEDDGDVSGDGASDDSSIFNLDGSDDETFTGCRPKSCTDLGANCGPAADGCGGLVECGTCTPPAVCGGGGVANVCGTSCKPLTCADIGATCGKQGDGCGDVIDCGTCTAPESCGGGGVLNACGKGATADSGVCTTKKTCADYGANCGWLSDGCGGLVDCGACTAPAICGGGGTPNVCGGGTVVSCTKKTCADYGANCGPIGDGCGGIIASCGTCTAPAICGGGGKASVCGGGGADGGTPTCVNLACKQTTCAAGATTSISGVVYDPAGKRPLPNVFVYVPNAAVGALPSGASCDKCSAALSGSPLVTTTTDVNGKFKLDNMPVDANVPVVIQIGKWRRQIKVTTTKCGDVEVDAALTRLPRKKAEGDIPKIALTTGGADPLECLLRKIGIDDAEFTNPDGTGRVNLFTGHVRGGGSASPTSAYVGGTKFPVATTLWASAASLQKYDVVMLGCEGVDTTANKSAAALTAMQTYVNNGGRVFGEHFHYTWMKSGPTPWPGMVSWNATSEAFTNPTQETVLTTIVPGGGPFPKGTMMNEWMKVVGAGSAATPSLFPVNEGRHSVTKINDTTNVIQWIQAPSAQTDASPSKTYSNVTQYFSFNTPVGAAPDAVCGRFVFSDIHVSSGDKVGVNFPGGCTTTTMTPQELALEFMFFDLASRVCDETVPPPPPTCTKTTCTAQGISCGPAPDGCGGLLDCGTCTAPDTCGGGGVAGKCGHPTCTKSTCTAQGIECGPAGDGCGGTLDCGTCVAPATCGGLTPGKCGVPPACVPLTCTGKCGPQGDGCGGVLSCPPCDGGTGCVPTTCTKYGAECGIIGDGCGGTLDCGKCASPKTCGGGGTPYKCGGVM